jgi:hypothetical protein
MCMFSRRIQPNGNLIKKNTTAISITNV